MLFILLIVEIVVFVGKHMIHIQDLVVNFEHPASGILFS